MDKKTLIRLEKLNQLSLTESEEAAALDFFARRGNQAEALNSINTDDTERMVHVMPMTNVIREDKQSKVFTRDQLLEGAPESMDGYWQVPRLVD